MAKKNMYKKSDRTFVNPYNFVSIDRKKIKQENIEETYKDKGELHTGYLDCVLVAKTPLAIPDLPEGEESGGESKHDFFSINGNDQKKSYDTGEQSSRYDSFSIRNNNRVLFIDDETRYAFVFKGRCRKKRNL